MREVDHDLTQAIQATAEIYGRNMSEMAATMLLADLDQFPAAQVLAALAKCRRELKFFPTIADIVARIDDGRPGPEEAWAMIPKSEYESVIWNDEIAEAFGVCRLIIESDPVAARMAFRETYSKLLADARFSGKLPKWTGSFGMDKAGRTAAVTEALSKGRISQDRAVQLLPDYSETPGVQLKQLLVKARTYLEHT